MKMPISIARKQLRLIELGETKIDKVEIHEILMGPAEMGGLHLHPCLVCGYVVEGTAIMQIEGEAELILEEGSAFYEPARTRIVKFGNYSATESLKFIAFYLRHGEQSLIEML